MYQNIDLGRKATNNEQPDENINMVVEDSLDEKNSSNDDNDLEAGTKSDEFQGNLLRGIEKKTLEDG